MSYKKPLPIFPRAFQFIRSNIFYFITLDDLAYTAEFSVISNAKFYFRVILFVLK
jgi:hypothetical protein